jgi:hypothetical protein
VFGWGHSGAGPYLLYQALVHAVDGFEPVAEVRGLADTWWRGPDSLVAVYTGCFTCFGPGYPREARIYSGLDDWGLHG